jgi:hypothetical protein
MVLREPKTQSDCSKKVPEGIPHLPFHPLGGERVGVRGEVKIFIFLGEPRVHELLLNGGQGPSPLLVPVGIACSPSHIFLITRKTLGNARSYPNPGFAPPTSGMFAYL